MVCRFSNGILHREAISYVSHATGIELLITNSHSNTMGLFIDLIETSVAVGRLLWCLSDTIVRF